MEWSGVTHPLTHTTGRVTHQTGIAEDVTEEELVENNAFLNAVVDTAPMRYVHKCD